MTRFEKVSFEQYRKDAGGDKAEYEGIRLPERGTRLSAGYDFFAPREICLSPGEALTVFTGVRARLEDDLFLSVYPRSGLGFRYQLGLANTVGIIDADYYSAKNEGHIAIRLANRGNETVCLPEGKAFAQGILQKYFLTDDDAASGAREGGFGSTDEEKNGAKSFLK